MKRKHVPFYWWWPFIMLICIILIMPLFSCQKNTNNASTSEDKSKKSIAVFVPGLLSGSPTYKMMNDGVIAAAEVNNNAIINTVEAGFNQGEWKTLMMELADTKDYDLIVTSNPAMPKICRDVQKFYPDQQFLCLEAPAQEDDTLSTFFFKHEELAYTLGHFAGLVTTSKMDGSNKELKIGLLAGQEYAEMTNRIKPGFIAGALTVNEEITLDYRVLGNWFDAEKAAGLTRSMIDNGVDVILAIAGGGNQGILSAAKEAGIYVLWYDTNGYSLEPGTVLGCGLIKEDLAAKESVLKFLKNELPPGSATSVGLADGYLDFIENDALYKKHIPKEIQKKQAKLLNEIRNGNIVFDKPVLK